VADEELARRRAAWKPRAEPATGGYLRMFLDHVLQANEGVDFDFLRGMRPVRDEDTRARRGCEPPTSRRALMGAIDWSYHRNG